jgi:hypothetical protein
MVMLESGQVTDSTRRAAELVDSLFALGKPLVMVLEGGRPFAIPEYYSKAAAVLNTVSVLASSS